MNKFRNINYIQILAILLGLRALYDFSAPQAAISISLFGYLAFKEYMKAKENTRLNDEMLEIKEKLKETESVKQELLDMRNNLSGLMMKNASRPEAMKRELENRRIF